MYSPKCILILFLFITQNLLGSNDSLSHWKHSIQPMLQLNQAHFSNWASGGQNSIAINGSIDIDLKYKLDTWSWTTEFNQNYGMTRIADDGAFSKTQDLLSLITKVGKKHNDNTRFTCFADVRTQVAPSYYIDEDLVEQKGSNFLSPGYVTLGLGYEYQSDSLTLHADISPIAGKQTIVKDDLVDETDYGLEEGKSMRNELGAYLRLSYKKEILERTELSSHILLFTNYLEDFGSIDFYWRGRLNVHANKWLAMSLQTQLIYDRDVDLAYLKDINRDGSSDITGEASSLQFMQVLGLGATVTF